MLYSDSLDGKFFFNTAPLTFLTCGWTSPTFPLSVSIKSEAVMNPGHLVTGHCYWSEHLPSRPAQHGFGRQGLLFLIIAGCQKPLVLEYFSSGTLASPGVSWSSRRKEVCWLPTDWWKSRHVCHPLSLYPQCQIPYGPRSILHTHHDPLGKTTFTLFGPSAPAGLVPCTWLHSTSYCKGATAPRS